MLGCDSGGCSNDKRYKLSLFAVNPWWGGGVGLRGL